jgi:hypothetical protein
MMTLSGHLDVIGPAEHLIGFVTGNTWFGSKKNFYNNE